MACGAASAAQNDDFAALKAHWSFDEGRDWHNMPTPFMCDATSAMELTGKADCLMLNAKMQPDNAAWISGRQRAGIAPGRVLTTMKELHWLNKSVTFSYWTHLNGAPNTRGVLGSNYTALWGGMNDKGQVGLRYLGRQIVLSPVAIHDKEWHHIVFTRDAATGKVVLYQDGKEVATGMTQAGPLKGKYDFIATNNAALDQIHIFDKPVSAATVAALYDNHAPQVFDQSQLVETARPSVTGSILHRFTYDVDQDKMSVAYYTQPSCGKVVSNGDGTFTYTPDADFARTGQTAFDVVVTDGRGGYSKATMHLHDSRYEVAPPVREFQYTGSLPEFAPTAGKKQKHRNPMAICTQGTRADLLIQADSRLWYSRNDSTRGKLQFAAPQVLRTSTQAEVETDGAAVLEDNKLIVRKPDGTLVQASVVGQDTPALEIGAPVKDAKGGAMNLPVRHFALVDYDHDGTPDLVAGYNDGLYYFKGSATHDTVGGVKKIRHISFATEKQVIYRRSYNIAPGVGDLNNDGRTDLLHGINWGTLHAWMNAAAKPTIGQGMYMELTLENQPKEKFVRDLNGAHVTVADFDGDGTPDMVLGGNAGRELVGALGINPDCWAGNLALIEKELYDGHEAYLGKRLEANDQQGLKRYRQLMTGWIRWAVSQNTPSKRQAAWYMLAAHVKKYPFLQRGDLKEAWVKREKNQVMSYGDMHHVPGIFTMNWIVLHRLLPDSAAHRVAVADALGMSGLDREIYLDKGMPLADNNRCSEGQLRAIADTVRYHAPILFPDDHISISQHFDDGRDAMCYIFESNKNTFGMAVGNNIAEMHGDMVKLTEECFGAKGAANGDYFTFVLAHEVCHSLDAYVRGRANKDLNRRWGDQNYYAATNAGTNTDIVANDTGWWDLNLTKERFKQRGLWDGKNETWNDTWKAYWQKCPYRNKVFMRGDIDWFLGSQQESLATQANHHWARSESRLIGAILRYLQGYKSNINEVVFYLDVLSAGQNKLPMLHPWGTGNPTLVNFNVEYAWLTRNDRGYITDVRIGDRHYGFNVDEKGRVTGLRTYPFAEKIQAAAQE
ncbi:MAG: VCBS repeat-containing protein [Akkermansia sp.]|nr:VCBS repeat-containing protein [Akkermansia sp.]